MYLNTCCSAACSASQNTHFWTLHVRIRKHIDRKTSIGLEKASRNVCVSLYKQVMDLSSSMPYMKLFILEPGQNL